MASKAFGGLTNRLGLARNTTSDSSSGDRSPPRYDADAERRASSARASVSGAYIKFNIFYT
jgi:hypothetical protein